MKGGAQGPFGDKAANLRVIWMDTKKHLGGGRGGVGFTIAREVIKRTRIEEFSKECLVIIPYCPFSCREGGLAWWA